MKKQLLKKAVKAKEKEREVKPEDDEWVRTHLMHLVKKYAGMYAIVAEGELFVGRDPAALEEEARIKHPGVLPTGLRVPRLEDFNCALQFSNTAPCTAGFQLSSSPSKSREKLVGVRLGAMLIRAQVSASLVEKLNLKQRLVFLPGLVLALASSVAKTFSNTSTLPSAIPNEKSDLTPSALSEKGRDIVPSAVAKILVENQGLILPFPLLLSAQNGRQNSKYSSTGLTIFEKRNFLREGNPSRRPTTMAKNMSLAVLATAVLHCVCSSLGIFSIPSCRKIVSEVEL